MGFPLQESQNYLQNPSCQGGKTRHYHGQRYFELPLNCTHNGATPAPPSNFTTNQSSTRLRERLRQFFSDAQHPSSPKSLLSSGTSHQDHLFLRSSSTFTPETGGGEFSNQLLVIDPFSSGLKVNIAPPPRPKLRQFLTMPSLFLGRPLPVSKSLAAENAVTCLPQSHV